MQLEGFSLKVERYELKGSTRFYVIKFLTVFLGQNCSMAWERPI